MASRCSSILLASTMRVRATAIPAGRIASANPRFVVAVPFRAVPLRAFQTTGIRLDLDGDFVSAQADVKKTSPSNDQLLQLYSLFKQATAGNNSTEQPSKFNFVARAKWDAWEKLKNTSSEDAKKQYVALVKQLQGGEKSEAKVPAPGTFNDILVTNKDGLFTITFNRPNRKNAFAWTTYREIVDALKLAADDDTVVATLVTGTGDMYSSGNDLSNFANIPAEGPEKMAADGRAVLKEFVNAFIHFPKLLIGAVNGPAIGVSVTVLGLFDVVYCSDKAYFSTPFTQLGQSPEGCSSYTFPRILGQSLANEVLLLNHKLTAAEAKTAGFVSQVFPSATFAQDVHDRAVAASKLPPQSMRLSRNLIKKDRAVLEAVNEEECQLLEKRWLSDECMSAIMAFLSRGKSH